MLKRTTKPLRRRVLIEEGLAKSSKKKHSENTDKWHLCKAGSFSYGESLDKTKTLTITARQKKAKDPSP